jgi:DNA (cytosine-5)-methyltransferase 1
MDSLHASSQDRSHDVGDRADDATVRQPIGIDLFAGAGGLSLGAMFAGVEIVAAVEKDRNACKTYHENLIASGRSRTRLFDKDILQLDPEEVMQEMGLREGNCDILLGGPPCQGFSSHRLRDSGVDDPRNALILRYFEFVKALRPSFFLVENVPGMLWERHRDYVETFYGLAAENDYILLAPIILNARDYGVPQNRKRVFLFGTDRRSGVTCDWPPQATHFSPDDVNAGLTPGDRTWRTASVVFAGPAPVNDPNDIHMRHNAELTAAFERTPINGGSRFASGRILQCHQGHTGHWDVYGRINPDVPGPTMTTACINPSKGRFVHPTEPHGITLRQAARFQTFPDWFVFRGGLMSGGEQIGNAVPVEMARILVTPFVEACRTRSANEVTT